MSTIHATHTFPGGQVLEIAQGDLTAETVDAIVNAANEMLAHGGGIAAAIVRRGGEVIQRESDDWVRQNGPITHARPAYTTAGQMPARYVIHAVGPVWGSGEEDAKLMDAVTGSLKLAAELGLRSIAFPAISTGIFGFPKERAAPVMLAAVRAYFDHQQPTTLQTVRFTLFDNGSLDVFLRALQNLT